MANQEHLDILKQGVEVWDQWRKEHPDIKPDFSRINFREAFLRGEDIPGDWIIQLDLPGVNFTGANFIGTYLDGSIFSGANFSKANFSDAILSGVILQRADFRGVDLTRTFFKDADLQEANLTDAYLGWTTFGNLDLSVVKGLDAVKHRGPSTIGLDTIVRSQGKIPESFLRKAGVPESIIEAIPSLMGSLRPIDYYTCFISHSSKDKEFVERLYADLLREGVRCWYAPEDLDVGDKIRPRIEESIRLYDKLLLVLSEHSIVSTWVAYEVERALNKEPAGIPNVLYPIRLDDTVMMSQAGWANDIKSTRNIGDFTHWENRNDYQKAFKRVLRALKLEPSHRL